YFQKRRTDPWHFSLATAAARLSALQQRQQVEQRRRLLPQNSAATAALTSTWTPIGPAPITGGQTPTPFSLPSPVSGRVSAIAIDPVDNAVFAGGAQGGIWRSLDFGATWVPLTDALGSLAVGAIAITRNNNNPGQA